MHKPRWLNKRINLEFCVQTKKLLRALRLHTVCEEARCPNISECFSKQLATFMILGDSCTRSCNFCTVKKAKPSVVDYEEPSRIKEAVRSLNLRYVVITSPTRDDLPYGGADMFYRTVKAIKTYDSTIKVEVLIPDFLGSIKALRMIANCKAEVISHNLETVPSLYIKVRAKADYARSLRVIELMKKINSSVSTKSGIMLGLGEKETEVFKVFRDLRAVGCDFLTLGQYLRPSLSHYPVKKYISPKKFEYFEKEAKKLGFKAVKSSPYARTSYLAHTYA